MEKELYITPAVRIKSLEYSSSLLTASSDYSPSSTLEGFEDNGEGIIW